VRWVRCAAENGVPINSRKQVRDRPNGTHIVRASMYRPNSAVLLLTPGENDQSQFEMSNVFPWQGRRIEGPVGVELMLRSERLEVVCGSAVEGIGGCRRGLGTPERSLRVDGSEAEFKRGHLASETL